MTDRARFGVVGTGPWAHLVHVPAAASSPRVRLAAVYGRDAGRADDLASLAGADGAVAFDAFDAFLDAVDIVGFAVPPHVQVPLLERALRAGKHVLVEKPVAFDPADADRLAAIAADGGLRSVVFFTHRFIPRLELWADDMAVQPWTLARVESCSSLRHDAGNPFAASPWRHERGALWDVGPHALARLCGVLGPVIEVSTWSGEGDHVVLTLEHASGAIATVSLASDMVAPPPAGFSLAGPAGSVTAPAVDDWIAASRDAYERALEQLAAEVGGAPAGPCDLAFGAHVTRVLAAAEASAASGTPHELTAPSLTGR